MQTQGKEQGKKSKLILEMNKNGKLHSSFFCQSNKSVDYRTFRQNALELRNASDRELQKSLPYKGQENTALEVIRELAWISDTKVTCGDVGSS